MKKITIKIKPVAQKEYPIFIGRNLIGRLGQIFNLKQYSKIVVVTDKSVEKNILRDIPEFLADKTHVIVLPDGERMKHIGCVKEIWTEMAELSCDRKTLVINIGGGVILDMGGFAASTYMRGVDFINIPTTLLSQVDASIGGKTGINFDEVKNLIGTFSQPVGVVIDINTLKTLPKREFVSGFGEIIKHGLIADKNLFEKAVSKNPTDFTKEELEEIIFTSCKIKADIVAGDEKEEGLRKILNFGHTVGHAAEILSHDSLSPLLHGEAVAIGMVVENDIAVKTGLLKEKTADEIKSKIKAAGLPVEHKKLKMKSLMSKIKKDKKNINGKIKFTLINNIGNPLINREVGETIVKEAIEKYLI